ncbi:MAG: ATP-binding cassette domain-containing protein [Spirochaetaceae bacterium]|jgi:D-methionine transport system ATP-binding protein|nr:ATP-binding cassette domain-containing protein [Spirochaetaceae bacterium]
MIRLEKITKTYQTATGPLQALNSIDVHIQKGVIFGFIGFSGAGKSTLLRSINLLERPDSGSVFIDNEDIAKLPKKELLQRREKIGMIFQHYNLLLNSTVYKNVAFPLEIMRIKKPEIEKRVMKSLEIVDLPEKTDDYPAKLSGGQKQRVAIARAITTEPKILLCDEVTSALDPQTTGTILDYLKKVNKELGITIVLVTHEMEVARTVCDYVGVLENGYLVETLNMTENAVNTPQSKIGRFLFGNGEGI